MIDEAKLFDILKFLNGVLKDKKVQCSLGGSANLRIQGVEIAVNDVDLTTDKESYIIIKEALRDYAKEEGYDKKKLKQYLICRIDEEEVEILYYDDPLIVMLDKTRMHEWKGLNLPILPLVHAKRFYELIGKEEKARLIEKYL